MYWNYRPIQLDLTERLKCAVAVILNLSPDHLDRHGGMAGYLRAKKRILRNQQAGDWASHRRR